MAKTKFTLKDNYTNGLYDVTVTVKKRKGDKKPKTIKGQTKSLALDMVEDLTKIGSYNKHTWSLVAEEEKK